MVNTLKIYCDGACSGNPGRGGWGAVLIWQGQIKELSGSDSHTTNNRMELTAAIQGLLAIKRVIDVEVYSDSRYVCDGMNKWIEKWKINGWKSGKNPVKNIDLWQRLDAISKDFCVISWHWVKGHSGDMYNEMADKLARRAISKI